MDRNEILEYAKDCGIEQAINLMILIGYDGFNGSVESYNELLGSFEDAVAR